MAFCEFSSEVVAKNSISLDNLFVTEFMPSASDNAVKVYLYGLYKCSQSKDNSIDEFAKVLDLNRDDIISLFYYWQEKGLVQVLEIEPISIRYLPIKNALQKMKKYNVDKYTAFNITAQELFGKKMLTPRELEEFYYLIENLHMEKEAVLRIIQYAVGLKSESASVNYIVTIAKNWAYDGIKTISDVETKIEDQNRISGDIVMLLKTMGIRRTATTDEYEMFLSWTKDFEFDLSLIIFIAKNTKSKTFAKLGKEIERCYALRLYSEKEILDYITLQESMTKLAKDTVKSMGLWYDNLSIVVDSYIAPWYQLGFDDKAILKLSNYAFRTSVRTLEGLNGIIQNLFKQGVVTADAIDNYIEQIVKSDAEIKVILNALGITREVSSVDRTLYKTWLYDWNMSGDIIEYACTLAKGKYLPMQYLNKVLSEYKAKGVKTFEEAKSIKLETSISTSVSSQISQKSAKKREYTKKELDSLYDNIYEIEI